MWMKDTIYRPNQISLIQAISLMIVVLSLTLHVEVIPELFDEAGRDAWVSILLLIPIVIFLWWLIILVIKWMGNQSLISNITSRWLRIPIMGLVEIYLILSMIKSLKTWALFNVITFLPGAPPALLALLLLFTAVWIARGGLQTVAITVGFLLPFIIFFGFFNTFSTLPMKDYGLVFPIWEHGIAPTFRGVFRLLPDFGDFFLLFFFAHWMEPPSSFRFRPWFITCLIIFMIALGVVMGLLAEFGPNEVIHLRFPAYEGWRLVTFGPGFERLSYLAIFQWTAGLTGRLLLLLAIGGELLGGIKRTPFAIYVVASFVFLGCLIPLNIAAMQFFSSALNLYALLVQVFVTFIFLVMGVYLKKRRGSVIQHA